MIKKTVIRVAGTQKHNQACTSNRPRHRRGRGGEPPRELRELQHTATDEPKAGKTRPSDATKS